MTYRAVDAYTGRLARRLRRLGVRREVLVAVVLPRSIEQICATLAVMKAGGAFAPLDPRWPVQRLKDVVARSRAEVVIGADMFAADAACDTPFLDIFKPLEDEDEAALEMEPRLPAQLAYVIHTSGSTGQPKGVEITHANLMNLIQARWEMMSVRPSDRSSHLGSPAFDSSIAEIWPALTAGASVTIAPEAVKVPPERLKGWLVREKITLATFVPPVLAASLITSRWPPETSLRFLMSAGEALLSYPAEDLTFAVMNGYGPTEGTVETAAGVVTSATKPFGPPPIGRPLKGVDVHILDEERRPTPFGQVGELYIAGAGVARGYRNQPILTAERFVYSAHVGGGAVRLYRTGDLCRFLPDGQLAYHGRCDNQVQVLGHRVEPEEVAAVLARHPDVEAAAVVGGQGVLAGRLSAYATLRSGADLSVDELQTFLATILPAYMLPAQLEVLPSLPLTPNGKVDRRLLGARATL